MNDVGERLVNVAFVCIVVEKMSEVIVGIL
jgi:hypothetical protein